ncbi:MAG: response regulator transcription factor [Aestuariivita sp.]|nr:response regulator transcription factor [Aestuariivita sp.]
MKITLVEDNIGLRKGITYRLQDDGHTVDVLTDGLQASDFLVQETSDVVILDINLPGQNGLELLRELRSRNDPRPVILLSARSSTRERIEGLDAGADDYLIKPFSMDELAARIRALARRKAVAPRKSIAIGPLFLDLEPLQLRSNGIPVEMPRRELSILACLADPIGRIKSKDQLLTSVYGTGSDTDEQVIEVYISRMRKRLGPYGLRIVMNRGIGYKLVAHIDVSDC